MTILQGYCVAGRPSTGLTPWGSFEGWSALVRQSIVWCGLPDPGDTRQELAGQADVEAVIPLVPKRIAAMIRLQALTGMRPGEVIQMKTQDIDRTGKTWIYVGCKDIFSKAVGREQERPVGVCSQELEAKRR